ncbi:pentatricopeptide repeat-containing protein At4g02750-like [Durio zibethinus]|uniref:Pentatricopeptide repeat-containing protein At4g02750-like n=1 Tax=Durio zibethinus TaxID=66656 RepID=A0A6P6A5Z0_DURZI|nr:pentatricopeptide repeat-containing protein At4g02750-like [Durio zibethinus]
MNHSLLRLLNKAKSFQSLTSIHARLLVDGSIASSDLVLNKFLRLYARFDSIQYAQKLFDKIPQPNAFLWTALIHGYVDNRNYTEALSLFSKMCKNSIFPLNFTLASVLKSLARLMRVKEGEAVYCLGLKCGLSFDLIVQNAVIDLLMRCGEVDLARRVFNEMEGKDLVSWNSMISGYGSNGRVDLARELFDEMSERNVISWTSMIQGYVKAGDMEEARVLFDRMTTKDLASWNVMVSGYIDVGDLDSALSVFDAMPVRDAGTWNLMIAGYCKAGEMEIARDFFDKMQGKNVASWTIMIDGYVRAGDVSSGRCLFDQMPEKNLVSWSTMIGGYARNGRPCDSLELYEQFKKQGIKPDETFVLGVISACSQLGILDAAESIIHDFTGPPLFSSLRIVTSLIDMYAKCGNIDRALQVFNMAYQKDLLCYSTMITAFANHGMAQDAISLFEEMQRTNITPDGVAFLGVLTACNHGGFVSEGRRYFKQLLEEYRIQPSEKHYACIVDLLGRAGCLEEAYDLVRNLPILPSAVVWGALLAACRVHCNVQLAEIAADELFRIEPDNSGNYILLSNIYAAARRWDGVSRIRAMIRKNQVRKNRASSWIELGSVVHEFVTGDALHFDAERIYFTLYLINAEMKLLGLVRDSEKEEVLPHHAFWLSDVYWYNIVEDG